MKNIDKLLTLEYGISLPEKKRISGDFPVYGSNGIVGNHNEFVVNAPCIIIGRKGSAGEVNWSDKKCTPIDTTFYVKLLDEMKCIRLFRPQFRKVKIRFFVEIP